MLKANHWIDTGGGPHVLLPQELRANWRGTEGWISHFDPLDVSDYARACRITDWLGVLTCGEAQTLVLSGDVGPIAWFPRTPEHGHLVQWIAADDEESIEAALSQVQTGHYPTSGEAEVAEFVTGASGKMLLFDAALAGDELDRGVGVLELVPGQYRVRAWYLRSERPALVIRSLALACV